MVLFDSPKRRRKMGYHGGIVVNPWFYSPTTFSHQLWSTVILTVESRSVCVCVCLSPLMHNHYNTHTHTHTHKHMSILYISNLSNQINKTALFVEVACFQSGVQWRGPDSVLYSTLFCLFSFLDSANTWFCFHRS